MKAVLALILIYIGTFLVAIQGGSLAGVQVNTVVTSYEKKFDVDTVTEKLVNVYDKHYTDDEIKGLLQFYGSPLGQKVAAESPKIGRELQEAIRTTSGKAAKDALDEAKQDHPRVGQNARLNARGRRLQQRRPQQQDAEAQTAQQQDPQ